MKYPAFDEISHDFASFYTTSVHSYWLPLILLSGTTIIVIVFFVFIVVNFVFYIRTAAGFYPGKL
jgi:hypothetical protein